MLLEIHPSGLRWDFDGPRDAVTAVDRWSMLSKGWRCSWVYGVFAIPSLSLSTLAAICSAHRSMVPYNHGSKISKKSGPIESRTSLAELGV
jgi:hypothetical protein